MDDIVEAALRHAEAERERGETDPTDEFGPPSVGVVGCEPAGVTRVAAGAVQRPRTGLFDDPAELDATTVGVGDPAVVDGRDGLDAAVLADAPGDGLAGLAFDVAVVTGHLDAPGAARRMATVCRRLDALAVAMPTVPGGGLSEGGERAFRRLVAAAGTTVPVDVARFRDAFPDADTPAAHAPDGVLFDLAGDLFEMLRGPVAAPADRAAVHDLLESGGVALPYWGWAGHGDDPDTLVEHAAAHRWCDGDPATATGGLGLVRFGAPYTLREFDRLRERVDERLRPVGVPRDRWQTAGLVARGLGEQVRLAQLFVGVDADTLPFLA